MLKLLAIFSVVFLLGNLMPAIPSAARVEHFSIIDDPSDFPRTQQPFRAIRSDFLDFGRVRPAYWLIRWGENVVLPTDASCHHVAKIVAYAAPLLFLAFIGWRKKSPAVVLGTLCAFLLVRYRRLGVDVFGRLSPQEGYAFFCLAIAFGLLLINERSWIALVFSMLFLGTKEHCLLYAPFLGLLHFSPIQRIFLWSYAAVSGLAVAAIKIRGDSYGAVFGSRHIDAVSLLEFGGEAVGPLLALAIGSAVVWLVLRIGSGLRRKDSPDLRIVKCLVLLLTACAYLASLVAWPYLFPRYLFLPVSTIGLASIYIFDYLLELCQGWRMINLHTLTVGVTIVCILQTAFFPSYRPLRRFLVQEAATSRKSAELAAAFDAFLQERGIREITCVTDDWQILWEPAVNVVAGYSNAFRGRDYVCRHIKFADGIDWSDSKYYVVGEDKLLGWIMPIKHIGQWYVGTGKKQGT